MIVIDASVALAWCFEDEQSDYAETVLSRIPEHAVVVPALWPIEVANGIWLGDRRKRITSEDAQRFFRLLDRLNIAVDDQTAAKCFGVTLELSRMHDITVYDATYLELAIRSRGLLASLDNRLLDVAMQHGIDRA